jgi:membrane AbrB-like protein
MPGVENPRFFPRWGSLLLLSAAATAALRAIALPGALLVGPMAAGIIVALGGARIHLSAHLHRCAQAIIGCMIAATLTPTALLAFADEWLLFLGVVLASLAASGAIGGLLCRWRAMPGTTAIWGTTPGAASAMVVMAEHYGADARLVAIMQYLRVICVALAASLAARFFTAPEAHSLVSQAWFTAIEPLRFATTLAVVASGMLAGRLTRIPSAALLLPLLLGTSLNLSGIVAIALPAWLQAAAFTVIGWSIGLRFTQGAFLHALRAMPVILLSIFALMAFCALLAAGLVWALEVDYLTAFLATSPGGADAIAIIAASAPIDASFVMGLQAARLVLVLLLGPPMAGWIARRLKEKSPSPSPAP